MKLNYMTRTWSLKMIVAILTMQGCTGLNLTFAQSTPQQIMEQIYTKYDSLKYITFDVKYIYSTDTLNGGFKQEALNGSYTMAGTKALYNIGDIEFMQNDSFFISVYNKDKFIIVADPRTTNTGSELPLRALIDSLIQTYGEHYTIHTTADSVSGTILFERADSMAQFNKFLICYDVQSNFLNSIRYDFDENEITNPDDTTSLPQMVIRKKALTVEFSNYRVDNFSAKIYSEYNYIWFEDGKCKPIDKYKEFKVYYSRAPGKKYQPSLSSIQ